VASRGFTYIEMVVTLLIMGTLAMVAIPMTKLVSQRAKEHELRAALVQIREALDAYKRASDQGFIERKVGASGYPRTLGELVAGVPDQRSPERRMLYFLRRMPRDPMSLDEALPADRTWDTRSYASPPQAPSAGEDVFDVRSRSQVLGINGVPYNQW
jgi:general secretion pathway protein G